MTDNQKIAYEWAKNQDYQSVAARYAKELAGLVDDLQDALRAQQEHERNDWICTLKCTALMEEGMCSHGGLCCLHESQRPIEENEPLTLDELRQMDGEPVWVSVSNNWRESGVSEGWCLVRFHSEDERVRVYIYDTRHGARFFAQQDYGISWLAYRQKPEEWTV